MRRGLLLVALALAACDASLDPLQPTDARFSLSGYLDASADSQWVRVEPLGPTLDAIPAGPLDVVATLGPVGGAAQVLAQEVRPRVTGPSHLFGGRVEVLAGETYRLEVRPPDGPVTAATVTVPDGSATVDVQPGPNNCPVFVEVTGSERVADVQARYVVRDLFGEIRTYRFTHLLALERAGDGRYLAEIYSGDDTSRMSLTAADEIVTSELVVALATADWPETVGLTLEGALGLNAPIENGVGFVGGVLTRRFPFTPVISQGRSCMSGRV